MVSHNRGNRSSSTAKQRVWTIAVAALVLSAAAAQAQTKAGRTPVEELSRSTEELAAIVSPAVVQIFTTSYAARGGCRGSRSRSDRNATRLRLGRNSRSRRLHPHQRPRRHRCSTVACRHPAARHPRLDSRRAKPHRRRGDRRHRSRSRSCRDQGGGKISCGAAVRRLRRVALRSARPGLRKPARPR